MKWSSPSPKRARVLRRVVVCALMAAVAGATELHAQNASTAGRAPGPGRSARVLVRLASENPDVAAGRLRRLVARPDRMKRLRQLPWLVVDANPSEVARLRADPAVLSVEPDLVMRPVLLQSTARLRAPELRAFGYTGHAWAVAMLDSGVESTHPALNGRVAAQACFSSSVLQDDTTSLCPGGLDELVGSPAGEPCTFNAAECAHGTHLAGVAAGRLPSRSGIAPASQIISVQIYSRASDPALCTPAPTPCLVSYLSDQVRAMEYVRALAGPENVHRVAAVNLSLSVGAYAAACDNSPGLSPMRDAVERLRAIGIATVAAAGNDGSRDALGAPACLSNTVSVGATFDSADVLASYSNRSPRLSLLAPGSGITSAVPGASYATFSGTSMAVPHVTGTWAVLKQLSPRASVATILGALRQTGIRVADSSGAWPRLDLLSAATALVRGSPAPPQPPAGVIGTVDGNQVTLTWQPPSQGTGATTYQVLVSGDAGAAAYSVGQTLHASGALPPGTYRVEVQAQNPAGASLPSAPIEVTVAAPTAPLPPAGLAASLAGRTVTLSWQAVAGATSYVLSAGSAAGAADLATFETGNGTPQLAVPSVPPGTYFVRVRARNAGGVSAASEDLLVRVP